MLVNGAAGGVGSIAVQLARAAGARVTGVDRGEKLALVRALGADEVVDHAREDVTRRGDRYGAGALTPVIDRTLPLDEAALALRHLQGGRARGRILVTP